IVFEKNPRLVICKAANGQRLTTYLREGEVHRALIGLSHAGAQQRAATRQESGKGCGVIVHLLPAVQRIPLNRLNCVLGILSGSGGSVDMPFASTERAGS